jgi:hypothetical protein
MTRGILDTSILVADDLAPIPGELAVSIASIAELKYGVLVARNDQTRATRLARLSAIERRFDPLPIDEAVVHSYARLATRVVAVGRKPRARVMDLLIAATAHAHDATIYTRNAADLAGLQDLVTIASI